MTIKGMYRQDVYELPTWSQRPEVMRNGARGGYMGKAYTKKEHDKCKQVAEAFQELYAIYGDMCVLDAGDFGFVHLKWFRDGYFDGNILYIRIAEKCLMTSGKCGWTMYFWHL